MDFRPDSISVLGGDTCITVIIFGNPGSVWNIYKFWN